MEKLYYLKLEHYGEEQEVYVNAVSELDAVMQARTKIGDVLNNCHVICIAEA